MLERETDNFSARGLAGSGLQVASKAQEAGGLVLNGLKFLIRALGLMPLFSLINSLICWCSRFGTFGVFPTPDCETVSESLLLREL